MDKAGHVVYEFGGFRLDPALRILSRDGEPVIIWPKVFDTLLLLLQSNGRVVEKEELMRSLWPHSFVEESNLTQNIFLLRKILGDDRNGNSFIQTVHRRGYRFVAAVRETEPSNLGTDLAANYWRGRSPFRGLRIFETEDAWLFFGREAETEELLTGLGRAPVLAVVGNSGSGKSSLLRAGLIPALQQGRFCPDESPDQQWRIAVFRPSVAPFDHLAEVLPGQLAPELSLKERNEFIGDCRNKLSAGADGLRNALAALISAIPEQARPTRILLVVDQFEELFTLTHKRAERERYVDALLAASRGDGAVPVHLVLALRADFYADCIQHAELSCCMAGNQHNVGRMRHEQLRENIEKRLQLAGAQAEAGLIDSLLEDVGSEPGNLALLEHALGQLWDECGGFGCTLTNEAYAEIGRLRGALGRHADEVYAALKSDRQKQLAQRMLLELIQLGDEGLDTRRRVKKTDLLRLGGAEEVEPLLAHLASSRLVATGGDEQEQFVEVSHEALIREWPLLRDWLAENREELRLERRLLHAAGEWKNVNRDKGALLQGARLAQAKEWLGRHAEATKLLQEFVEASVEARAEAEQRELARQKAAAVRLRWFSCVVSVLLLLAVGAACFIYRQQLIEKSHALAAQSGELLSRDRGQALDLAIRSWGIARTEEARLALTRAFPEPLVILRHDGAVKVARFSPDGHLVVSASYDQTARVWDTADGRLLYVLRGHTDKLQYATFSPNGKQIVTASDDHTARVWSSADGRLLFTLKGHSDKLWRASFSPDGKRIITSSFDNTARVWNTGDGRPLAILRGHTSVVGIAEFSPNGQYIVTASWDHTARIWNSIDGRLLLTLPHSSEVIVAAFSPDNQTVATGTLNGMLQVWNSADGRLLFTTRQDGSITSIAYSADNQRIVTANLGNSGAWVWNSTDGRLLFKLDQGDAALEVQFSRDGSHIVTSGADHTARIWNSADGRLLATLQEHSGPVWDAEFSPDGQRIVTASDDQTVRIWTITTARSLSILRGHKGLIYSAFFSPDGQHIVTASADKTVRVWNSITGRLQASLQGHTDSVQRATFFADNQRVLSASLDKTARVWNTADGRLLTILQGHSDRVWSASFSPDGLQIVTGSYDLTARVWNAADGSLLTTLRGHSGPVVDVRFSPDGQRILTASLDHTARLWNAVDGRLLAILNEHTDRLISAQFSPDGQQIVTASLDHTARVWNAVDGRLLNTLQGHTGKVVDAQFSPHGQRIVTASDDHTARVWNAADGGLLSTLQGHTDKIVSAHFSPDGKCIVTASQDGTARIWRAADGRLIATLQGHTVPVTSAEFSPDSQRIVTSSLDTTARIWELLTLDDIGRILAK